MNQGIQVWWRWLVLVVCGVMIFSLGMVVAPNLIQQFFDIMFFSSSQAHTAFGDAATFYIKFVYGVLGAVMIGWMTTLLCILVGSFRRGERDEMVGGRNVDRRLVHNRQRAFSLDGFLAECCLQHSISDTFCHSASRHISTLQRQFPQHSIG